MKDLVIDAIVETTNLVESTHRSVSDKTFRALRTVPPLAEASRVASEAYGATVGITHDAVRLVARGVGVVGDAGWALAGPPREGDSTGPATAMRSDVAYTAAWWLDSTESALNAVVGDFLRARGNAFDLGMTLRRDGRVVPLEGSALSAAHPNATGKVCVFVHGLGTTEWCWSLFADRSWGDPATCYGTKLEAEHGYTSLYLRYNTGAHVSQNGERLSALLESLLEAYPVPIEELVLVGHSMGGLVARSATHYGATEGRRWTRCLRHVVCIGSPHFGAPLEKLGNVLSHVLRRFDVPGTQVPARILDTRSAGIKDLRFGYTVHEEWQGRDPDGLLEDNRRDIPFIDGVTYSFVASTLTRDPAHPIGALLGDLLVRLPSATGEHRDVARRIPFRVGHVISGTGHLHLANHPDVYAQLERVLELR